MRVGGGGGWKSESRTGWTDCKALWGVFGWSCSRVGPAMMWKFSSTVQWTRYITNQFSQFSTDVLQLWIGNSFFCRVMKFSPSTTCQAWLDAVKKDPLFSCWLLNYDNWKDGIIPKKSSAYVLCNRPGFHCLCSTDAHYTQCTHLTLFCAGNKITWWLFISRKYISTTKALNHLGNCSVSNKRLILSNIYIWSKH